MFYLLIALYKHVLSLSTLKCHRGALTEQSKTDQIIHSHHLHPCSFYLSITSWNILNNIIHSFLHCSNLRELSIWAALQFFQVNVSFFYINVGTRMLSCSHLAHSQTLTHYFLIALIAHSFPTLLKLSFHNPHYCPSKLRLARTTSEKDGRKVPV